MSALLFVCFDVLHVLKKNDFLSCLYDVYKYHWNRTSWTRVKTFTYHVHYTVFKGTDHLTFSVGVVDCVLPDPFYNTKQTSDFLFFFCYMKNQ